MGIVEKELCLIMETLKIGTVLLIDGRIAIIISVTESGTWPKDGEVCLAKCYTLKYTKGGSRRMSFAEVDARFDSGGLIVLIF
tara:strand:+ start:5956 stop:6204 length:249 start_codon:yes stop_codon:yes gene_type:complete